MHDKWNRRRFITGAGAALIGAGALLPGWARSGVAKDDIAQSTLTGSVFDLVVDHAPITIDGRKGKAITVNGTVPGPLLRWREGQDVTLHVTNRLRHDTSIHWHGILLPFQMDGVPGISFPGIKPGSTFTYRFRVRQAGTYWYHSHSGLQEQRGHYGPLIIDPADTDPVQYDREYVIVLSDWTFMDPHRLFATLKKDGESLNYQKRTLGDLIDDMREDGLGDALSDRLMWGAMRMAPTDIADVTGATYDYLINGHGPADNWTALFKPGERVRLRIINAAAMSLFNIRIPGLAMTVVQCDGQNVAPVETDEFQIGVAETYDVVVTPQQDQAFTFMAEAIDRSGYARATLAPRPGMRGEVPALRPRPLLTMKDMGMGMNHDAMDHGHMDHGGHSATHHDHPSGIGVASLAEVPVSRLHEPGIGLEDVPHRALNYAQLRSLSANRDTRQPGRELEIHLTGNMERYMWSFDGVKFSHIDAPIVFHESERLRLTMVNDTMMPHPIHLHGMFFELVNGGGAHQPRKHTVIVKPGEKLSIDITADEVGDWAFHCHLLYHMHAGMMQVVSVKPQGAPTDNPPGHNQHPHNHHKMSQRL